MAEETSYEEAKDEQWITSHRYERPNYDECDFCGMDMTCHRFSPGVSEKGIKGFIANTGTHKFIMKPIGKCVACGVGKEYHVT